VSEARFDGLVLAARCGLWWGYGHAAPCSFSASTKRGKEKLVILTAERYGKLIGRSHTAAYGLMDAPQQVHDELMDGLEDIIETDNA
jgi:hypothetical protein